MKLDKNDATCAQRAETALDLEEGILTAMLNQKEIHHNQDVLDHEEFIEHRTLETVRDQRAADAAKIANLQDRLHDHLENQENLQDQHQEELENVSYQTHLRTRTYDRTFQANRYHGQENRGGHWQNTGQYHQQYQQQYQQRYQNPQWNYQQYQINSGKDSTTNSTSTTSHNSHKNGDLLNNSNGVLVHRIVITATKENNTREYAADYRRPEERFVLQRDGTYLDLCPQWPWDSIYFHQPSILRRQNELFLYGYTFSMGL